VLHSLYSLIKVLESSKIITVCVITYNHNEFISHALNSIAAQKTNFNYDILIADDCSTDGTKEKVLAFSESRSNVSLILQESNVGPAKNFVELISTPKTKYISYLEGDDHWTDPYKLQKQVDYLEANPNVSCCATDFDQINKNGVFIKNPETYPSVVKLGYKEVMKSKWCPTQACTILFKKELVSPALAFLYDDLIYCGDWALSCWFSTKGEVHILPDTTCTKRMDSGGIWTSKSDILNAYRLICFSSRMPRYLHYRYKKDFYQNLVRDMPIFLEQLIHLQNFKESNSYIFALIKIPIHISFIPSILKTFLIIVMNTIRMKKFSFQ
jgi:glycosyltransferase involved in cell wall biosynthesis